MSTPAPSGPTPLGVALLLILAIAMVGGLAWLYVALSDLPHYRPKPDARERALDELSDSLRKGVNR